MLDKENQIEEFVKLSLDTYNDLLEKKSILAEISNCISVKKEEFDKNGNKISYGWFGTPMEEVCNSTKEMSIDMQGILRILKYDIQDYDNILINSIIK